MAKVLFLGGAGAMARAAIASSFSFSSINEVVIADRDGAAAARAAASWPGRASALQLDILDARLLAQALGGVDAVVNCAGPFYRIGLPALDGAIAAKRTYLDICDDWEPTLEMLARDDAARAAGVTALVGMGASPGVTNLLAVAAARGMERVETIITGWNLDAGAAESVMDAERKAGGGSIAAVQHWLHQLTGTISVWRLGRRSSVKPFTRETIAAPDLKPRSAYLVGHPEPLTLPRHFPGIEHSRNVMVLPRRDLAAIKALAARVERGTMTIDAAARLMLAPTRLDLWTKLKSAFGAALDSLFPLPTYPPLFAAVRGFMNGQLVARTAWVNRLPPPGMAGATGVPLAVALKLALSGRLARPGVITPEEAFDPDVFFEEFAARCTPESGPLLHVSPLLPVRA